MYFFAAEQSHAVSAITGFDVDFCFVDKFHVWPRLLPDTDDGW